jgi:hypothetical protein
MQKSLATPPDAVGFARFNAHGQEFADHHGRGHALRMRRNARMTLPPRIRSCW